MVRSIKMEKKTLGNYQIMIASKYFERIDDFINVEIAVKRFRGNMERFHFNPIPLNDTSRKLFSNLETLHLYNKSNQIFTDGKIFKECIWYTVDYETYLKEKEKGNECKLICYTQEDQKKYGNQIPNTVKILGFKCFSNCSSLTTISIPTTISSIGSSCFSYCTSLTSIEIPTTIKTIEYDCFKECLSLETIKIPTSVSKIGNECFYRCISLETIEIPTSVSYFGDGCFSECISLTSIEIPTSVVEISDSSFEGCSSLTSITIPKSVFSLGVGCFYGCSSIKRIEIPTSVKCIGNCCFSQCPQLKGKIEIPVTYFEKRY